MTDDDDVSTLTRGDLHQLFMFNIHLFEEVNDTVSVFLQNQVKQNKFTNTVRILYKFVYIYFMLFT